MERGARQNTSRVLVAVVALLCTGLIASCGTPQTAPQPGDTVAGVSVDPQLAARVPQSIKADGMLTFATDPSYEPMEFLQDGVFRGVDMDIARAVSETLGLSVQFKEQAFSTIAPAVAVGSYEAGISSMWADDVDARLVNMVTYLNAGNALAVRTSLAKQITGNFGLCGHSVATEEGTQYIDKLVALSKSCQATGRQPINIKAFELQSAATDAVQEARADAMVADSPVVTWAVATSEGQVVVSGKPKNIRPYGICVSTTIAGWPQLMQSAVQRIIDTGVYAKILAKWDASAGAIPTSQIIAPH